MIRCWGKNVNSDIQCQMYWWENRSSKHKLELSVFLLSPENHDIQDNDATFFPRSNDFILKPDEMFTTSLGGEKQYNYNIFDDFWLVSCSLLNNSINRRIFSFICVGSQRQSDYNQIIIDASANIISNFWDFWEKQNLVRLLLNPPLTLYHVGGQTGSVWLTYEQA